MRKGWFWLISVQLVCVTERQKALFTPMKVDDEGKDFNTWAWKFENLWQYQTTLPLEKIMQQSTTHLSLQLKQCLMWPTIFRIIWFAHYLPHMPYYLKSAKNLSNLQAPLRVQVDDMLKWTVNFSFFTGQHGWSSHGHPTV